MSFLSGTNALAATIAALFCLTAASDVRCEENRGFLNRTLKDASREDWKYVLFVPHDYRGDKAYPLILFLHGLGESGSDGHRQATVGLGPAIKRQEKSFDFITIFPQSRHRTWRPDSEDSRRALDILAEVRKNYRIDPERIYLTGLSMGGYGTWSIAIQYPDRWAAIVPVCGGGDAKQVDRIKDVPCWCFHGGADKTVPARRSREMIEALKAAGGHPLYTEYPGVEHNSWDRAYATPELFTWLRAKNLKQ
jgi:predicted peptidase